MILASWAFACWGLDMIGPFKPTPTGFCWVNICIDKFSKWIEYRHLVQAKTKKATKLLDHINASTFSDSDF